jgi:hypothetical protein
MTTTSITLSVVAVLAPVFYGGLGACVYLLRSLHKHIHERTFDRRHKPEYYSRVILGVTSGGVISILAPLPGSGLPEVGIPALAFVVGYNTDLLYSLIERVSTAIFPKVPDPAAPGTAPSLKPPPPPPR